MFCPVVILFKYVTHSIFCSTTCKCSGLRLLDRSFYGAFNTNAIQSDQLVQPHIPVKAFNSEYRDQRDVQKLRIMYRSDCNNVQAGFIMGELTSLLWLGTNIHAQTRQRSSAAPM